MQLTNFILLTFAICSGLVKASDAQEFYSFCPELQLHFVVPDYFVGDTEVYIAYSKISPKYGSITSKSKNYIGSDQLNVVECTLGFYSPKPALGIKSLFSYLFLHTGTRLNATNDTFKRFFVVGKDTKTKNKYQISPKLNFYFTVSSTPYKLINFAHSTLFFCGGAWDKRYAACLEILDSMEAFNWYGSDKLCGKKSYRGYCTSIIDTIAQHGVALVLHSKHHIANEEPSLRIFEASAASALIISDKHPFIVKHFGDSVLYIDQNDSEEKIAEDIMHHYAWVKSHPTEAANMTRRSHKIFLDKFTLEDQLLRLIHVHQETLILDGHIPLPPRTSFLHNYTHLDQKKISDILNIVMPRKLELINQSEVRRNLKLSLLNPF
ncbi:MAG: glycosyltransferase, partial [Alphaproteobacteria bacterium]|nr:glycosyltransferase [Alphaproteobacteria bacterium]